MAGGRRGRRPRPPKSSADSSNDEVARVSHHLSMPEEAVLDLMENKKGANVRSSRSRGKSDVETATESLTAKSNSKVEGFSAWSDFMSEEMGGSAPQDATDSPLKKKARTEGEDSMSKGDGKTKDGGTAAAVEDGSGDDVRRYHLPIGTRMAIPDKSSSESPSDDLIPTPGVLAQTGSLDVSVAKRNGTTKDQEYPPAADLMHPTILFRNSVFRRVKVALIAASCSGNHSVAIDINGIPYSWGRNDSGQVGAGESVTAPLILAPRKMSLAGWSRSEKEDTDGNSFNSKTRMKPYFVGAAVGRFHTILIDSLGQAFACGSNKAGQCGVKNSPDECRKLRRCVLVDEFKASADADGPESMKVVQASCGENFSVLLTSLGHIYSAGSSEFGQLGNGTTGEYIISANKTGFAGANRFERRREFVQSATDSDTQAIIIGSAADNKDAIKRIPMNDTNDIVIGSISCGRNHTIAVEAPSNRPPRVFSWGDGGYGCLGHNIQADEYRPRLIAAIRGPLFAANSPVRCMAGTQCSMILTKHGHVYYWGRHRTAGEAAMKPTLVDTLANNGHDVKHIGAGNQTVFCSTQNVTVSWGFGPNGELGFGKDNGKSSSKPRFVTALDKRVVTDVACGYGHTLFLLRHEDAEDKKALKTMSEIEKDDVATS